MVLDENMQDVTWKKQNICYLKMELTMRQIGDKMQYTEAQREEVRQMAEFV